MKNKLPITRLSKFFSQTDFDLNVQLGEEYLHGDLAESFRRILEAAQKIDPTEKLVTSSMTQLLSGGTNGTSTLTDLSVPILLLESASHN